MLLKICGIKQETNMQEIVTEIKPDYLGFIFYNKSARYMQNSLSPEAMLTIPKQIKKVGVFVNETFENILKIVSSFNLQAVQLHGSETSNFCEALKKHTIIIKAFGVDDNFNFDILNNYKDVVDYFLFDTKTVLHGGSGVAFNWQVLNNYNINKPYILSGGLNNENITEINNLTTQPFMLDVNSQYEDEPGLKNLTKLLTLKKILNHD